MATSDQDDFLKTITRVPVVAGVLIADGDKYLVLEHRQPDAAGLWGWPAGFVSAGHTLEETAIREAKEETGLDVRVVAELGVYHSNAQDVVKHLYAGKVIGGRLRPDGVEISAARWLTEEEVKVLESEGRLRAEWIVDGIVRYRRWKNGGHDDA